MVILAETHEQLEAVLEAKATEREQVHQRLLREREDWLKGELAKRDELLARCDHALLAAAEAQKQSALDCSAGGMPVNTLACYQEWVICVW